MTLFTQKWLFLTLFFLSLGSEALAKELNEEWEDLTQTVPSMVHPVIAAELKEEFQVSVLGELKTHSKLSLFRVNPEWMSGYSDLNLIEFMGGAVFLRHKVGVEALEVPNSSVSYLSLDLKRSLYDLARSITGALLLDGGEILTPPLKAKWIAELELSPFGRKWVHSLWSRFYDSNGVRKLQNQIRTISVAYTKGKRGIGFEGHLPWGYSMPTDFERFLRAASGHWGIMSRVNFESAESKKQRFKGTENIIISRDPHYQAEDCFVVTSLEEALKLTQADPQVVIFGGSKIYELALGAGLVDRILITEIDADLPVDTQFPTFDMNPFQLVEDTGVLADERNRYPYQFLTYERKPSILKSKF